MKVLEIKGIDSWFAFNSYHKLMFGLKMLPMYAMENYVDFYERIEAMPDEDQEKMLKEAVFLVDLSRDEVKNLLKMATDANGVRYSEANVKSLGPLEIFAILLAVCKEIVNSKPKALSEDEKKKSQISP